jgi:mono/diheme cytochrome c family protein
VLFAYTKLGGREALARQGVEFDSGMPAFADVLSNAEIRDVLAFIKSTWSPRTRSVQAERTAADERSTESRK